MTGKWPAVTGMDRAKLFDQHCIHMKKKREDKKTATKKAPNTQKMLQLEADYQRMCDCIPLLHRQS